MANDPFAEAYDLRRRGEPFALATVVRCVRPTSAKPGAKAIIRNDGTVSGWIGGSCAEPVVVKEGLQALRDGQPRLVTLVGEGGSGPGRQDAVREYPMSCHSGGTIEIFVEPVLPRPELVLIGAGPVIGTLETLARAMDFSVRLPAEPAAESRPPFSAGPNVFIVVASHGTFDEDALEQALRTEARYVSLVASRKRAAAIIETLRERGVPAERLARLKAPAGLAIGAVTPEEIAVSILAEIIQVSRSRQSDRQRGGSIGPLKGEVEATDPVCGMSVKIASARYRSERAGQSFYFCCAGCKRKFDDEPARYAGSATG
jgi:xanthine dehydrogenase accessory factor